MFDQHEKFKEILNSDRLEVTLTMNILISAAKLHWDKLNTLDKFLLGRALQTIESYANNGEDFIIKFNKEDSNS